MAWAAALLFVVAIFASRMLRPATHQRPQPIAVVTRQDFIKSVRVNGTVEAVQFSSMVAPLLSGSGWGQLTVTKLVPNGSTVHKGDLLVEFDPQAQIKFALDREADYHDLLQQIEKKKADQAAQLAADQSEIVAAEDALKTAKLEIEKNEIVSKIDAEKNEEAVQETTATLAQLKETFQLKRRSAEADMHVLEIQRDRAANSAHHARANTEGLAMHALIDGIVVLNTIWKGGGRAEIGEGDELWPGTPLLKVVNPAVMQVRAHANQSDLDAIQPGLPARISLDAYYGTSFPGKVEAVAAVGQASNLNDKVHSYPLWISISGSDPRLMPDLSAAVDIELERVPRALTVPRDVLVPEKDGWAVYRQGSVTTDKVSVKVGSLSDIEAVILSGVKEGDKLLRTPDEYRSKP